MYKRMQKRDDELAEIFDNPRHSVVYMQIALAVRRGAIKKIELSRFTDETQEVVALMLDE